MSVYPVSRPCHGVHQSSIPQGPNTPIFSGQMHAHLQRRHSRHDHRSLHTAISVYPGVTKTSEAHPTQCSPDFHHGASVHPYALQIFRHWDELEHAFLEGRDEGMALSCRSADWWVHDDRRLLQQRSRPRRNMLWLQGREQMQIPNWRGRHSRRSLCWMSQWNQITEKV